jgi:hypothetical protein
MRGKQQHLQMHLLPLPSQQGKFKAQVIYHSLHCNHLYQQSRAAGRGEAAAGALESGAPAARGTGSVTRTEQQGGPAGGGRAAVAAGAEAAAEGAVKGHTGEVAAVHVRAVQGKVVATQGGTEMPAGSLTLLMRQLSWSARRQRGHWPQATLLQQWRCSRSLQQSGCHLESPRYTDLAMVMHIRAWVHGLPSLEQFQLW